MQLLALFFGSTLGALIAAIGWFAFGFSASTALTVYFACAMLPAALSLVLSAMQVLMQVFSQEKPDTAPVTR